MKKKLLNIYKPIGWTPLEVIKELKKNPDYKDFKCSYAGRLDPMAEGVMLVLVDEMTKDQESYQRLHKEYIADIAFGFSTDSYDLLGLVTDMDDSSDFFKSIFLKSLDKLSGTVSLELPSFSSFEISSHPLFWWAREDRLNEIEIPKKSMNFIETSFLNKESISKNKFSEIVISRINKVNGDFRQVKILNKWNQSLKEFNNSEILIAKVRFKCSSGTYIRSCVNFLSKKLSIPLVLFNLKRSKVGLKNIDKESFSIDDSLQVEDINGSKSLDMLK